MPSYKVPAEAGFDGIVSSSKEKKQQPHVTIPMKPAWLEEMQIGQQVEIMVKGEVVNLHMDENSQRKSSDVSLAVATTEYYKSPKQSKVDKVFDDAEEDD